MKDKLLSIYYILCIAMSIALGHIITYWFSWVVAQQIIFCCICALIIPLTVAYKYLFITSIAGFVMVCIFLIHFSIGIACDVSMVYSVGCLLSIGAGILAQKYIAK